MKSLSKKTPFSLITKCGLVLLSILSFGNVFGQNLLKYVPSNAPMVMTMNLKNLDKKVNLDQLKQYDFYTAMVKSMRESTPNDGERAYYEEMLVNPANIGFDTYEPFYFFVTKEGDITYMTLATKMGDRSKFEAGLQTLKADKFAERRKDMAGYQIWQGAGQTFAWNDEVILFITSEKAYSYEDYGAIEEYPIEEETWSDEEYSEEEMAEEVPIFEEEIEEVAPLEEVMEEEPPMVEQDVEISTEEDWGIEEAVDTNYNDWNYEYDPYLYEDPEQLASVADWADKVMNRRFLLPMSANEDYRAANALSSDAHFWLDYGFFMEAMGKNNPAMYGMGSEMRQMYQMMQGLGEVLYSDTYLSMGLNFEQGRIAINSEMFFNEEMKKFYQGALDVKLNKKFLRYVKGDDQMFGYMYVNYNIKKTIEEGKGLLYKLLEATPTYGEMGADAMKILGIFIDEDAIANLLKGDMLVAVSGMQTVPVTQQTFELDADFNFTTKDTVVMKSMPIFTAQLSYGNEKDIMKFVNLGLHSKVMVKEGAYYKAIIPDAGLDLYLALHKGVMLITNDRSLVHNNLQSGYPKKQRLSKKHKKALCDNSAAFYWDIPNTMAAVIKETGESNIGMEGYFNTVSKEFQSMEMTSSKNVGNSIKGNYYFNFTNKDQNSLQELFNFINSFYIDSIGGGKS